MNYLAHHTAISVINLDKTIDFYATLGFKRVHRYDDDDRVGVKLKLGDYVLEIFAYKQNKAKPKLNLEPGNNLAEVGVKHIGFTVDDVDAALADLKSKNIANDKTMILTKGEARFFFVKDPDGVWVEIIKDDRY